MDRYQRLLDRFVQDSRTILNGRLVGIYLHGSAAMGCFNPRKSDLDLIVVVSQSLPDEVKRHYMGMVVRRSGEAPAKGLELSVVRREVCSPFVYPTPFELHASPMHLDRYRSDPERYLQTMTGTDRDLAAHFTVLRHRGRVLWGPDIRDVFGEVDRAAYLDSIRRDIEHAAEEIENEPVYFILNLCRVLAYQKEQLILSKQEGGGWGLSHCPERFRPLIAEALTAYQSAGPDCFHWAGANEFARYMLAQIGTA